MYKICESGIDVSAVGGTVARTCKTWSKTASSRSSVVCKQCVSSSGDTVNVAVITGHGIVHQDHHVGRGVRTQVQWMIELGSVRNCENQKIRRNGDKMSVGVYNPGIPCKGGSDGL